MRQLHLKQNPMAWAQAYDHPYVDLKKILNDTEPFIDDDGDYFNIEFDDDTSYVSVFFDLKKWELVCLNYGSEGELFEPKQWMIEEVEELALGVVQTIDERYVHGCEIQETQDHIDANRAIW